MHPLPAAFEQHATPARRGGTATPPTLRLRCPRPPRPSPSPTSMEPRGGAWPMPTRGLGGRMAPRGLPPCAREGAWCRRAGVRLLRRGAGWHMAHAHVHPWGGLHGPWRRDPSARGGGCEKRCRDWVRPSQRASELEAPVLAPTLTATARMERARSCNLCPTCLTRLMHACTPQRTKNRPCAPPVHRTCPRPCLLQGPWRDACAAQSAAAPPLGSRGGGEGAKVVCWSKGVLLVGPGPTTHHRTTPSPVHAHLRPTSYSTF